MICIYKSGGGFNHRLNPVTTLFNHFIAKTKCQSYVQSIGQHVWQGPHETIPNSGRSLLYIQMRIYAVIFCSLLVRQLYLYRCFCGICDQSGPELKVYIPSNIARVRRKNVGFGSVSTLLQNMRSIKEQNIIFSAHHLLLIPYEWYCIIVARLAPT